MISLASSAIATLFCVDRERAGHRAKLFRAGIGTRVELYHRTTLAWRPIPMWKQGFAVVSGAWRGACKRHGKPVVARCTAMGLDPAFRPLPWSGRSRRAPDPAVGFLANPLE
jgi:hypothetical protein